LARDLGTFEKLEPRLHLAAEARWVEGEAPFTHNFNITAAGDWYRNSTVNKSLLSPGGASGNWLSHYTNSGSSTGTATYRVNITNPGQFDWWIRLNPFSNSNGGNQYWTRVNSTGAFTRLDAQDVSSRSDLVDPGIDIRFIGWKYAGKVNLALGNNTIDVRITGSGEVHGGIDAMSFTNFPWAPSGIDQPNPNPVAPGAGDWFPLRAGPDSFSNQSIIDMSSLNEDVAGSRGRIVRSGDQFVDASGNPIKFWGIGAAPAGTTAPIMQQQARWYAKHGINMVRLHPVQDLLGELQGPRNARTFDPAKLDLLDRWFAAMKNEGIYTTWSIFYHHVIKPDERVSQGGTVPDALYDELPARGSGKDSYGYATFVDEFQDSQWTYANLLLNRVNPYTGIAYKNDPALVIVEARNEDSIFFHNPLTTLWNERNNAGLNYHVARLRSMFGTWVKTKYASQTALTAAWGSTPTAAVGVDNWTTGLFEIMGAFHMGTNGPLYEFAGKTQRAADFTQFLAEMQRADYQNYYNRLRGIGFNGVIVTTAWKSGGPSGDAANLWSDDVGDAIDRHNYFGGGEGGHNIATGDVTNDTHLLKAGRALLTTGFNQVEDKPFIMTEWTQSAPNQYKAEAAPLMAFYGMGLQGWDASYQFTGSRSYYGNGWPDLSSYVSETPHYMGQFPALRYAIEKGHITQGASVAARRLNLTQGSNGIFNGTDVLQQSFGTVGYDTNEIVQQGTTPAEALAVGRVTVKAGTGLPASTSTSLTPFFNTTTRVVTSNTGQLVWRYGDRYVEVRSSKTQGVIGFAGGRTINLPGVVVNTSTPFVSLLLTPLDDRPLDQSERILVTAMAQDRQRGSAYNTDGSQLTALGTEPLEMQPVQATLAFNGSGLISAKPVDVYGVPIDQQIQRTGNTVTIDGRYSTFYYEIVRDIVAPSLSSKSFAFESEQAIRLGFSENVQASIASGDFTLTNLTTGAVVPASSLAIAYDAATNTATLRPVSRLPDGDYRLTVSGTGVLDAAGNAMGASQTLDFFVLAGDANRDRRVNFADLLVLAQNYEGSGRSFSQGNFDYSTGGVVGFSDLLILAQNYEINILSSTAARSPSRKSHGPASVLQ
jgi:hypothetical protein